MKNTSDILIIFDGCIDVNSIQKELSKLSPRNVNLFPLTSNWRLIFDLKSAAKKIFGENTKVKLMESAKLIDKEVDVIREKVPKWSADFGNYKIADKSIKEWFLLPRDNVSTWWFSLLLEKNSFKTDAFLRLAQLQAIDKAISSDSFDLCFVSVENRVFLLSLEKLCKRHLLKTSRLSALKIKRPIREKFKSFFNKQNTFSFALKSFIHFSLRILKAVRSKLAMGSIKNRTDINNNSVLFVSYFPAVDKKAAKDGLLKNKYAVPLQEKLSKMNKNIIWIWMYAFLDGQRYGDALKLAKMFKRNGETNFFLEEFTSFKISLKILSLWVRQSIIFLKLKKLMPDLIFIENLSIPEGAVFIKNLMARSFIGWIGLNGILFFCLFKEVFSHFPHPSHCIYYLEMQAWEKALNAAKLINAPRVISIGYQHVAFFRNLAYLYHPSEIVQEKKSIVCPLPDILACNGDLPLQLLSKCKYPNLKKVEAIRYLYLNDYLGPSDFSVKQNRLLIVGSTDIKETKALISFFFAAFPKTRGFEVWLKGHPALPFEKIFRELKIDVRDCGYIIKHDPVVKLLETVKILIVGSSTVAIEGLARSCEVITPVFSNKMFMSPMKGFEEFYIKVHNPLELRKAIENSIEHDLKKQNFNRAKEFVSKYWCLDPSLKRWEELLSGEQSWLTH